MGAIGPISETPPSLNLTVGPGFHPISAAGIPIASTVYLYRFQVPRPVTVTTATVAVSTISGNIDVGIYSSTGVLLGHAGSTACPNGVAISLLAPITLLPGVAYYAAIVVDNTTVRLHSGGMTASAAGWMGVFRIASRLDGAGFPLPNNVTPGTVTTGGANDTCIWFS